LSSFVVRRSSFVVRRSSFVVRQHQSFGTQASKVLNFVSMHFSDPEFEFWVRRHFWIFWDFFSGFWILDFEFLDFGFLAERRTTKERRTTTNDDKRTTTNERRQTTNDDKRRRTTTNERRTTNDDGDIGGSNPPESFEFTTLHWPTMLTYVL